MPWFPDLGYDGDLILSEIRGELIIGDNIETLSASAIISTSTSEPLPILEIYLVSHINDTQSIMWGDITYGEERTDISSTANIVTHTSIPDMTVGINPEILYVDDHAIHSNVYASMTQNYKEIFSGNVLIRSELYSFMDDGRCESLPYQFINIHSNVETDTGFCINLKELNANILINSKVHDSKLLCDYSLHSNIEIQTNIECDLYIGTISALSSTCEIISNVHDSIIVLGEELIQLSSSETFSMNCDGILYLGITEVLLCVDTGILIKSKVENEISLITNQIFLLSSNNIQSNCEADLTIGESVILSSQCEIYNNLSSNLIIGRDEILSSTCGIQTNLFDVNLNFGIIKYLSSNCLISTQSFTNELYLFKNIFSTISIITDSYANIVIGEITELSSNDIIHSEIHADLQFGIEKYIDSHCVIQSFVNGLLDTGVTELLASSIITTSEISSLIVFGADENLSAISHIKSNVLSDLSKGDIENIYGNCLIQSNVFDSSLNTGIFELISTNLNIITTESSSLIVFGNDENLSAISHIKSNVLSDLSKGNVEHINGNISISTNLLNANLIVDEFEWFTATCDIRSNINCFMDLGIQENVFANGLISSNNLSYLSIGHVEELSATCHINIDDIGNIEFGIATQLNALNNIITESYADLQLGGITELFSHCEIITDSSSFISFGINTPLSAHLNIFTESDNFILIGREEYFSALNIILTDSSALLTLGKDESITANASIHTNFSCDKLGISFYLSHANCEIISNVIVSPYNRLGLFSIDNHITSNVNNLYEYTFEIIHKDIVRKFTYDLPVTFAKVVIRSNLTKNMIPFGSEYIDNEIPFDHSFIDVLFRDDYSENYYRYLYRRVIDRAEWPTTVLTRLMLNPLTAQYYRCDGTDTNLHNFNIYSLQSDDLLMIDYLLAYRNNQSVNYETVNYNSLTTNLSRMIYIYLDVKIHNNNSKYLPGISMSGKGDILENCFEIYLIENIFNQISRTGTWN